MVDEGNYTGIVTGWKLGQAQTGTPQFEIRFAIEDLQVERTIYRYITDATIEWFRDDLKNLGFKGKSFCQLDPEDENAHSFMDLEIPVSCKHETYNGQLKERWNLNYGSGGGPVLEKKEQKKLDAMFGSYLGQGKSTGNGAPKKKPAASPAAATEGEEVF